MLDYSGMPVEEFRHRGWGGVRAPGRLSRKPQRLSITQSRPETSYQGVMRFTAGRTVSFVGTMLVVSLCAIGRDALSRGTAPVY